MPVSTAEDAPATGNRRQRGMAVYAKIFAVREQEVPAALAERVGPVFAEEALQAAGGAAWCHPGLSNRERSVAIITALTAQGVSGDRLSSHLHLGRQHGLDEDALTALMTLLASYLGYARASFAMEAVQASSVGGASTSSAGSDDSRRRA